MTNWEIFPAYFEPKSHFKYNWTERSDTNKERSRESKEKSLDKVDLLNLQTYLCFIMFCFWILFVACLSQLDLIHTYVEYTGELYFSFPLLEIFVIFVSFSLVLQTPASQIEINIFCCHGIREFPF